MTLYKINFLYHQADVRIKSVGFVDVETEEVAPTRDRTASKRRHIKSKRRNRKKNPTPTILLWLVGLFS